jgi:periplasmic divalent cation tolerance protein
MTGKIVVLCTCATAAEAARLARMAVEEQLAACATIIPAVHSVYRWQGAVEEAEEHLLVMKTTQEAFSALSAALRQAHSYETPEIVALPVVDGSAAYLEWLGENVHVKGGSI